jgi:hypothetical protein
LGPLGGSGGGTTTARAIPPSPRGYRRSR